MSGKVFDFERERAQRVGKDGAHAQLAEGVSESLFSVEAVDTAGGIKCILSRPDPVGPANIQDTARSDHAVANALEIFAATVRGRADLFARDDKGAFLCSVQVFAGGVRIHASELAGRSKSRAAIARELRDLANQIERGGVVS